MTAPVPALVAAAPAPPGLVPVDLGHTDLADVGDAPAFTPVPLRTRHDGWTPDRQRRFIVALAEKGAVGPAAAAVGMDERGAYRLRRRADAASFAAAWDAALAHVNDRLLATAYERAFAGRLKPHLFRGEVVFEEVIHSERLLVWLLTHGAGAAGGGRRAAMALAAEAEAALAHPDETTDADAGEPASEAEDEGILYEVWWDEEEGEYRTNFPPAPGCEDWSPSDADPLDVDYSRPLSPEEEAVECARRRAETADRRATAEAARRAWFGLDAGDADSAASPPGLCDLPRAIGDCAGNGGASNDAPDRALSGGRAAPFRAADQGDCAMGLFQSIKNAIFGHHDQAAAPAAPQASAPAGVPGALPGTGADTPIIFQAAAAPAPAAQAPVDVEAVLTQKAAAYGKPNNWRTSIVDLLTLLGLDSSLSARKELANELNVHVGADGSAEENIALHKAVMQELAKNGGTVPDALLHA